MKIPWPSSGKNESTPEKKHNVDLENKETIESNEKLFLNFKGRQYDLDSVPKEVQELIPRLEMADRQLQLYKDTIELISLGRDTLITQINDKLTDIPSLND